LPWVLQIRSNAATGQVDVLTAPFREAIQQQEAAGGLLRTNQAASLLPILGFPLDSPPRVPPPPWTATCES
jgi:hypothetical protein